MKASNSITYFRAIPISLILSGICVSNPSFSYIANGDFNNNNFDGWTLDTDGFGAPSASLNDFSLIQRSESDRAACLEIDYYHTTGDPSSTPRDEAIYANTLYQSLDFNIPPTHRWRLGFDWSFNGEEATQFDDNFLVGLADGSGSYFNQDHTLGFLTTPSTYGSGHFESYLDDSFNNETDWSLEFQLLSGIDGYGSYVHIDNVRLTMQPVPLPGAFWLFFSSLIMLIGLRKAKTI